MIVSAGHNIIKQKLPLGPWVENGYQKSAGMTNMSMPERSKPDP